MDGNVPDQRSFNTSIAPSGIIKQEERKRIFYVWSVVFLAVFLGTILYWPLTVKRFKSTARCQVVAPTSSATFEEAESAALNVVRDITDDRAMKLAVELIGKATTLKNSFFISENWRALRETVKVSVRPGNVENTIVVQLSIEGKGTEDEKLLVNHLASQFAIEFSRDARFSRVKSLFDTYTQQINVAETQDSEDLLGSVNSATRALDAAEDQFRSIAQEFNNQQKESPTLNQPVSKSVANSGISALRQQEFRLVQERIEKERLNDWTIQRPEIARIQKQIDDIRHQIDILEKQELSQNSQLARSGTSHSESHKKNQFALASATSTQNVSLSNAASKLESIDFNATRSSIDLLSEMIRADSNQRKKITHSFRSELESVVKQNHNALSVNEIDMAKHPRAIGCSPGIVQLMLLSFLGLGVATVVTWKFEPALAIKTVGSEERLEHMLRIPLLATIATKKNTDPTSNKLHLWSLRIVRCCEAVLLTMLIGFLAACLVDSQFVMSFFKNPLDAVARLFSLLIA